MRWHNRERSANVEDRRSRRPGFGGRMPMKSGGVLLLLVAVVAGYYGVDLTPLLEENMISTDSVLTAPSNPYPPAAQDDETAHFTSVVLKTTEDVWSPLFRRMGKFYRPPRLVLYTEGTETGCGFGNAAMGPFYCPGDETVYLDLAFYREMENRLGGGGDFAQGYVLAHEVGHHVQHLLGISDQVQAMHARSSRIGANRLSVMLELQADCFAGVWGSAMQKQGILDPGDLEEALNTAEAIGDDRLQKQGTGRVVPDSFTHGSSQQRYYWFKRGFDSGDLNQCNTFADY